jgi:ATP-dependent Clp protease ATP-binding subunit ClpC
MLTIWSQPALDVLSKTGDTTMFERFTDRARRVVVLAQEEARLLGHSYIGTEHLLLGLLHENEGVAAKVLDSMAVTLEKARELVEEIIGKGGSSPFGHIPFTPRAKKVLELALREALPLGHNYIGTEHLLLGIVREGEGVAMQVLTSLGVTVGQVRDAVSAALDIRPRGKQDIHTDSLILPISGLRVNVTDAALNLVVRSSVLAAGETVDIRHIKQALQELEGT